MSDEIEFIQLKQSDVAYVRDELIREQQNICPICDRELTRPVLDHHHIKKVKGTGRVRQVICSNCNVFLAKIENNAARYGISVEELPNVVSNISTYLFRPQTIYIHPTEAPKRERITKRSYQKLCKKIKEMGKNPPCMSKTGILTKPLREAYEKVDLEPEFYKK